MLGAAHVLAMNAKNLLDVLDCIREHYPNVNWRAALNLEVFEGDTPEEQSLMTQKQIMMCQNLDLTSQNQVRYDTKPIPQSDPSVFPSRL